jgi:O-antigen/teichoic acid export membrane protein
MSSVPHDDMSVAGRHTELKRKTFGSVVWTLARIGTDQVFAFLVFAILARLLTPHDMGLFALALVFAEVGKLVATVGFPEAVIRDENLDRELADTLFWANLAFGGAVAALLFFSAEAIGGFFQEPGLAPILETLACVIPLSALGSVHTARKLREFGHKSMAGRAFLSGLIGGGLGVYGAFEGWGVWSLVAQRAAMEGVSTLLAWGAYPWLPRFRLSPRRLRAVLGFSGNLMLTQVLWLAMVRCQDMVVGRLLNAGAVGVYRVSWRAVDLLTQFAVGPFNTAAMPALSRLQTDRTAFAGAYLRFLAITALVAFPALLGFGAVAEDAVPWVFGERWREAGRIAQTLSLMAVPTVVNALAGPTLAALGRSGAIARLALLQLLMTLGFTLAAAPYGLEAVAGAYVLRAYLTVPLQVWLLRREAGVGVRAVLRAIFPPLLAAFGMVMAIVAAELELEALVPDRAIYLLVAVPGGALVYLALLLLVGRRFVAGQIGTLRSVLGRR